MSGVGGSELPVGRVRPPCWPCSALLLGLPDTGSPDGGVLPARGTGSKGSGRSVSRVSGQPASRVRARSGWEERAALAAKVKGEVFLPRRASRGAPPSPIGRRRVLPRLETFQLHHEPFCKAAQTPRCAAGAASSGGERTHGSGFHSCGRENAILVPLDTSKQSLHRTAALQRPYDCALDLKKCASTTYEWAAQRSLLCVLLATTEALRPPAKVVVLDAYTATAGVFQDRDAAWRPALRAGDELVVYDRTAPSDVVERLSNADVAVVNKVLVTDSLLSAVPTLGLVSVTATGVNNVDLDACKSTASPSRTSPRIPPERRAARTRARSTSRTKSTAERRRQGRRLAQLAGLLLLPERTTEIAEASFVVIGGGATGNAVATAAGRWAPTCAWSRRATGDPWTRRWRRLIL